MKNKLIICNYDDYQEKINKINDIEALLLSANSKSLNQETLKTITNSFLNKNCIYFLCAGEKSEMLHDSIDDFFIENTFEDDQNKSIVTTFHHNETIEDIIHFFIFSTLMDSKINNEKIFIYLMDKENKFDVEIYNEIIKFIEVSKKESSFLIEVI